MVIPEIADYELRRELVRAKKHPSVQRLDRLCEDLIYLPLSTKAIRRAAHLWAEARMAGQQTADDCGLDGDVILAAQASEYSGAADVLTVATDNARHLQRFVDAKPWEAITP